MDTQTKIIKKSRYINCLYDYGFFVLCYLIDKFEKEENYEECELIVSAIKHHNEVYNDNIPTSFDKKSKEYLEEAEKRYKFKADNVFKNFKKYGRDVIRIVNKNL